MNLLRKHRFFVLLLLVLLSGLWGLRGPLSLLPRHSGADVRTHDADTHYFVYAWQETPTFAATLKWWHGPWGQKFRPFYRPIPSLLFWSQYKLFGLNGAYAFYLLLFAWHMVALLFLWRFLVDLLGEKGGTFATCLWGASVGHYLMWMAPVYALMAWKDTVESWHALAHIACLWAFLRFLKTDDARRRKRWQGGALLLFGIALCVKEMAYMAPFVMLLLCWHQKQWHQWRATIPFFFVAGVMFFFRLWALGGMGFRMPGNRAWKFRLLNDNLGGAFTRSINGDCLMLAFVVAAVGAWCFYNRHWARGAVAWLTSFLLLLYTSYKTDLSFTNTLSRYLVEYEWVALPLLALLLFFWWRFFLNRNRHQIFGALFALIVYAPLTSGANTAHIYYFPAIGWSIWLAYALRDAFDLLKQKAAVKPLTWKPIKGTT